MKINVADIKVEAKALAYDEPTDELNAVLDRGAVRDFDFTGPMHVRLEYYLAGQELFFHGSMAAPAVGHCARCLEEYALDVQRDFQLLLVPHRELDAEMGLEEDDLELSFYHGEQIDLSPLVREQVLLALPSRALCSDQCKGLCPRCGANLNTTSCSCPAPQGDPRLAVLRGLKVGQLHH